MVSKSQTSHITAYRLKFIFIFIYLSHVHQTLLNVVICNQQLQLAPLGSYLEGALYKSHR